MNNMYAGLIGTHQRNALSNGTTPTPYGLPFLKIGGLQLSYPLLSQEQDFSYNMKNLRNRTTDFKFGGYIYMANRNKSPLKILEKIERRRIQRLPNFLGVPPIISGTGKATDFKFCGYIYIDNPNKSLLKISEKRERGRI